MPRRRAEQTSSELPSRLRGRQAEIETAVLTRVFAVADTAALDTHYTAGLKAAVCAAVEYGLAAIELGEDRSPSPPPALLAQARLAARSGVNLDTVLRRYFAGHSLLADFIVEEAERNGSLSGAKLQRLLRGQAALFDRLVAAVSEEYSREVESRLGSPEERRAERIERLLAGEPLDTSELDYDLGGHHIGLLARGQRAPEAVRELAALLDRRLLIVRRGDATVWAWLGGRHRIEAKDVQEAITVSAVQAQITTAVGEPAQGLAGWRLTHRQAAAALPIALRRADCFARYADVALLATLVRDDLLATSLRELCLIPLERERDGGEAIRETLRAYFAADRNVSSAAAALGVSRNTVTSRLHAIEAIIGRPIHASAALLEVALSLDEL